jgi:hypothetical protein
MSQSKDEELIQGARLQFAESAATMLEETAHRSPCLCPEPGHSEHDTNCPIAIWQRAARTVRLLAEG